MDAHKPASERPEAKIKPDDKPTTRSPTRNTSSISSQPAGLYATVQGSEGEFVLQILLP
jgi:hypothetical protein